MKCGLIKRHFCDKIGFMEDKKLLKTKEEEFNDYISKSFFGRAIIRYGEKAKTVCRREEIIKARKDGVDKYYYYNADSGAEIKCLFGFLTTPKFKKLRDFNSWCCAGHTGVLSGLFRISLPIKTMKRNEEKRLTYELLLNGYYQERQTGIRVVSHDFYFNIRTDTDRANLEVLIPNGKVTVLTGLTLRVIYKGDFQCEKEIQLRNKEKFILESGYGKGWIRKDKKRTSVYWNINSKLKRGMVCKVVWYTKPKQDKRLKAQVISLSGKVKDLASSLASRSISQISYGLVLLIPYIVLILLCFKLFDPNILMFILLIGVSVLVLFTHLSYEWISTFIQSSLRQRRVIIPRVFPSEVNHAISNFSVPYKLESNSLLDLEQVSSSALRNKISKVDALRELLRDAIEYFNPNDGGKKRTAARLKYEILRMMAYEGATESQIMWDLGFDVYTRSAEEKSSNLLKPRFPLRGASEYYATSDRSFKRLKKEAVEMVRWRLESQEK